MNSEQTRAALMVLALGAGVVALASFGSKSAKSGGHRRTKAKKLTTRKRSGKATSKTKRFDGKGYTFSGSHQYKAEATKAAEQLRKDGRSVRVTPFRWTATSKPQWGVFVR